MNHRPAWRLSLLFTLACNALPAAANQAFTCPALVRLSGATVEVDPPAPSFTPQLGDKPLWLTGASAYDGPPEQGAALKPALGRRGAAGSTTVWHFEGPFEAGKWLSCDYAHGLARLSVQVNPASTRCEAQTGPARGAVRASVRLDCR